MQGDLSIQQALLEFAPLVLPPIIVPVSQAWSTAGSKWQNMGRGPALELAAQWSLTGDTAPELHSIHVSKPFLPVGDTVTLDTRADYRDTPAAIPILVLHYNDVYGQPWHTTWNLPSDSSQQPARMASPVIFNPRKWSQNAWLHKYCQRCAELAKTNSPDRK